MIVDAPDLPPEECEFFITSAGVADTEKVEGPESKGLDFKVETLFEGIGKGDKTSEAERGIALDTVKGIGKGSAENLMAQGIMSISDLLEANPDTLSAKISGASSKTVLAWQTNAKALVQT